MTTEPEFKLTNITPTNSSPNGATMLVLIRDPLGKTSTGREFILTDSSLVDWELTAVQGSAEFNNNVLNISQAVTASLTRSCLLLTAPASRPRSLSAQSSWHWPHL